jgi:predicted RNA-binding Zn ribbon-like protein
MMYEGSIMMRRAQISLEAAEHREARRRAAELGISLAEYIRRLVRRDIGERPATADVSALFALANSGGSDIAAAKDSYLGEAVRDQCMS